MKEIVINSKKYGVFHVQVDDADYEELIKYNWYVDKVKNKFYATKSGYPNSPIRMHRFIMKMLGSKLHIDHKDRNTLNNQRGNLRICTNRENSCNKTAVKNKTSKYLGVWFNKRKGSWRVDIKKNRKYVYSRSFKTEIEAAKAYNENAVRFHGEFTSLNQI